PDGKSRMQAAKEVVAQLLRSIPDGRNVSIIIYGHDAALECQAVKVVLPLQPWNPAVAAQMEKFVQALQPVGHTPIAAALRLAGAEIASAQGLSQFVLITDGMETCHGDPAKEAEKLVMNKKLQLRSVDVVGLALSGGESKGVMAIARSGLGKFVAANDS